MLISCPLRTSVIGSYPFPGWLELAVQNLEKFGPSDREELVEDAVIAARTEFKCGPARLSRSVKPVETA